jgi:hypothetical protein
VDVAWSATAHHLSSRPCSTYCGVNLLREEATTWAEEGITGRRREASRPYESNRGGDRGALAACRETDRRVCRRGEEEVRWWALGRWGFGGEVGHGSVAWLTTVYARYSPLSSYAVQIAL